MELADCIKIRGRCCVSFFISTGGRSVYGSDMQATHFIALFQRGAEMCVHPSGMFPLRPISDGGDEYLATAEASDLG